jgi:hypothetical protein
MPHVDGDDDGVGYGIFGHSPSFSERGLTGNAVFNPDGNPNDITDVGVFGKSDDGTAMHRNSNTGVSLGGICHNTRGKSVRDLSNEGTGVHGRSEIGRDVEGLSDSDFDSGNSINFIGVY